MQDLVVEKKVEVFEADPSLDQGYTMSKGNKANYLAAIQTALGTAWIQKLPISNNPVALLVDVMTFILNYQHLVISMFHERREKYLKLFLSIITDNCNCVHSVGDRCDVSPELSLWGEERERRTKISCRKMIKYKPYDTLAIPDWKSVVHNPLNKSTLSNYMEES